MESLAHVYAWGTHSKHADLAEAIKWHTRAAELGNTYAMEKLQKMYATGRGGFMDAHEVTKDARQAAYWANRLKAEKQRKKPPRWFGHYKYV